MRPFGDLCNVSEILSWIQWWKDKLIRQAFWNHVTLKKKSINDTRINPCPISNISMCALVEERLIQVGVSIHNVAQKRLEFGPYDLPISIRRSSSTPVQVSFTGLYPRPEMLIPFLLGNFRQQFSDLFRNRKTVKLVSPLMLINDSNLIHIQDYAVKLSIFWTLKCLS